MTAQDAIRVMVRHFPGGIAAMALRIGKATTTLEKELRGEASHKLGLVDACHISSICIEQRTPHCRAYVNAVAAECGGFVELDPQQAGGDGAQQPGEPHGVERVRKDVAELLCDASESLRVITEGLRDGVMSDNELRAAERELAKVVEVVQDIDAELRRNNAESKPRAALVRA